MHVLFINVVFVDKLCDFGVEIVNVKDHNEEESEEHANWQDEELVEK